MTAVPPIRNLESAGIRVTYNTDGTVATLIDQRGNVVLDINALATLAAMVAADAVVTSAFGAADTVASAADIAAADAAILTTANVFTKAQNVTPVALAVATNAVAVNMALSNNFTLALQATTSQVLSNPTNATVGQTGTIKITQNATPSALTFGSSWLTDDGNSQAVSTTAGALNTIRYEVIDATHIYYHIDTHGIA